MDKRLRALPLLRCFEACARHQSYSVAADELAITQAAVSQQIRNLEQQLAVQLFARDGRKMHLTKSGATLFIAVTEAFATLSGAFSGIQTEPIAGVLTVTASHSFCSRWLVPRLWKFSVLYPDIAVRALASPQFEELRHSDIDVAIRQGDNFVTKVHQELLLVDPVFPVCSVKVASLLKTDSALSVCDMWLVEAIPPGLFSWRNWFEKARIEMQPGKLNWIEVTTWEMGINAVLSGHGICLSSAIMVQDMLDSGLLVKPFDIALEPGLKFSLLYDEESPRLARIQAFREWLKSELSKDISPKSLELHGGGQ
ncbi:LysR substrate-binding domain-containing protein [Paraglaciecola sp.]|uniref:LysR substrate-binding domain-containing protein n=1 Tax=Paraglaciecola sp. TaxID=1920173 RepID=UPI0030F4AE16